MPLTFLPPSSLSPLATYPPLKRRRATTAQTPLTTPLKTSDGATLHTHTTPPLRPPSTSTALLLHDFMTDHRLFSNLAPHLHTLAVHTTTIAYDLRGFGRSSHPKAPYSHFSDLRTVANTPHALHLVAVGMSGPIILEFAIKFPQMVRSLVCISSGLPGHQWPVSRMLDITEARGDALRARLTGNQLTDSAKELVRWKQTFISANETWRDILRYGDREVARQLLEMARDYRGFHFFESVQAEPDHFADMPLLKRLGEVEVPVLVMVGEKDTEDFKEIGREIVEGVRQGVGVVEVEGAGHFAVLEQSRETAEEIVKFWKGVECSEEETVV